MPRPHKESPCPYNFKGYMGKKRFQAITKCLTFTDAIPPVYRNKFWQVMKNIRFDTKAEVPEWCRINISVNIGKKSVHYVQLSTPGFLSPYKSDGF